MAQSRLLAFKSTPTKIGIIWFIFWLSISQLGTGVPGINLIMEVIALRRGQKVWKVAGKALSGGSLVAEAELTPFSGDKDTTAW